MNFFQAMQRPGPAFSEWIRTHRDFGWYTRLLAYVVIAGVWYLPAFLFLGQFLNGHLPDELWWDDDVNLLPLLSSIFLAIVFVACLIAGWILRRWHGRQACFFIGATLPTFGATIFLLAIGFVRHAYDIPILLDNGKTPLRTLVEYIFSFFFIASPVTILLGFYTARAIAFFAKKPDGVPEQLDHYQGPHADAT